MKNQPGGSACRPSWKKQSMQLIDTMARSRTLENENSRKKEKSWLSQNITQDEELGSFIKIVWCTGNQTGM